VASVDAAINLVVRGQQRVDRLLQSLDQVERAVAGISNEPIQFDVAAPGRELDALVRRIESANQRINRSREQMSARLERSTARPLQTYIRSQGEVNRLEERGVTTGRAYEQAVGRRDRALTSIGEAQARYAQGLEEAETALERNNAQLAEGTRRLQAQGRALRIIDTLANSWNDVTVAVSRCNGELEDIPRNLSSGQIRSEIRLFDQLASSVDTNSEAFKKFVIASQSAGQALGDVARRRVGVLAEAFSATPEARVTSGRTLSAQEVSRARQEVERLLQASSGRELVRSEAGLSLMIDQLQQIRTLIPFVDANYGRLTQRIAELNDEMNRGMGRVRPEAVQRPLGVAVRLGGGEEFRERQRYEAAVTSELSKQAAMSERIANARLTTTQRSELQNRLSEANNLLADHQLEAAKNISREIDKTRHSYERLNRDRDRGLKLIDTVEKRVGEFFASANRLEQTPGMFDSSDLDAFVNRIKTVESLYSDLNAQNKRDLETWDKKLKRADRLREAWLKSPGPMLDPVYPVLGETSPTKGRTIAENTIKSAQIQLRKLTGLEIEGIDVANERARVEKVIFDLSNDQIGLSDKALKNAAQQLNLSRFFVQDSNQQLANARKLERLTPGATGKKPRTPEQLEEQRNRQLQQAFNLIGSINSLEKKGAETGSARIQVEQQIADLKQKQGQITQDNARLIQSELAISGTALSSVRADLSGVRSELVEASKATGFAKSFQDFQESLKGSRTFFGDESPAQAIDKIVREFNKGTLSSTSVDGEGAAAAAENVVDTYASKIRAGIPAAAKAMMDLGKAGIAAIKKALGIASPSRVMLEIAINQVDTYVDYLRAAIPQVEAVAKAMGEAGTPSIAEIPSNAVQKVKPGSSLIPNIAKGVASVIGSSASEDTRNLIAAGLEGLVEKKGQFVDIERAFGKKFASNIDSQLYTGLTDTSEMKQLQQFYADFYSIPEELTPGLKRASASAQAAEQEAVQLNAAVIELASGLENITRLIQSAAALPTSSAALQDPWGNIAPGSQEASKRYMGQVSFAAQGSTGSDPWDSAFDVARRQAAEIDRRNAEEAQRLAAIRAPFEASTQRAAQLDEERRRAATAQAFAPSAAQATADANAAATAISQAIQDPIVDAAPEGERQVRNAIQRLFDKISSILGGLGGGGGGLPPRPPVGPGGPAGPGGGDGSGSFGARLGAAEAEGVEALLSLQELKKPSKATTKQLEILSAVLKDVYVNLDPTSEEAKKFNRGLRRTTARLDEIVASRAPDADPLVRLTRSPRLAQGISEGLIGGAFPLLFGQGAGAAAGGGLGGFAGGFAGGALGFGLSLIGTAVGTAVDTFVNNMKELGKSLKDPTAALTAMETAGLRVTPQLQDTVERLQSLGLAAAAQAVVFSELEAQLGKDGAAQVRALTAEQKKLDEAMQGLNATLMSMLLPSVTGAISIINDLAAAIKFLAEVEPPGWVKNLGGAAFNVASVVNPGFGLSRMQFEEARKRGRQSAEEASRTPLELIPEQQRQQELALPRAQLEALNTQLNNGAKQFTDQVRAAAREQQDLDLQRRDLIESYERSIGDLRLTIERQVTQERLANAGRENEILAAQGEVRLQQLRNANAELTRSLSGNEFGQQLADAVTQFTEQQLSTENEIANRRRNLELELETKRIQTEQYRADIAKQIEQLNLSTAKQVASIQLSVARKNEDYDRKRFQLEKQIAAMNLNVSNIETQQKITGLDLQMQAITDLTLRQSVSNTINQYKEIIKQRNSQIERINAAQPPAPTSFSVPALGASVSTSGIDQVVAKGVQLARQLESIRTQLNTLVSEGNFDQFNDRLKNLADQGVQSLTNEYKDLLAAMSADPTAAADKRISDALKAVTEGRGIQGSAQREELTKLVGLYGDLAKQNIELARTYEFLTSRLSSQLDQIEELKEEFNSLTVGNTEYEKTLIALVQRGVDPASEGFSKLVQNAQEIDRLNQKIQVINGFRTAATELTGSMRSLVEQFFELGSASEAVKRVSDELGRKAFGFVLDIAFKPAEEAMQKTMFDLAEKLGFDIKPESLKQLQEIATIRNLVQSIEQQIKAMTQVSFTSGATVAGETPIRINGQDILLSNNLTKEDVQGYIQSMVTQSLITATQAPYVQNKIDEILQGVNPAYGNTPLPSTPGSYAPIPGDIPFSQRITQPSSIYPPLTPGTNKYGIDYSLPSQPTNKGANQHPGIHTTVGGPQSSLLPSITNGIGGPDPQRQVFPLASDVPYPDADLPTPGSAILKKAQQDAINNIRPLAEEVRVMGTAAAQARDPLMEIINQFPPFGKATADVATTTSESSTKIAGVTPQWSKNLGAVVTGLGMATSAVVGIIGGIGSIQKGGAGNIFSGIGSILTTIGGIGMSAAGFMKSGPVSPTAAGGDVWGAVGRAIGSANGNIFDDGKLMRFANGGVLQSPTLFNFEDAGVTKAGQAGEAGVEAVMPLKRTKDGRLGVEADLSVPFEGGSLMVDEESAVASQGSGSIPFRNRLGGSQQQPLSIPFMKTDAVSAGIDGELVGETIKFESNVINTVEYVTRQEAEQIGRTSAARGAELAQRRIKNNPQVRRSIGMSQ
jgi:hypothetical protein